MSTNDSTTGVGPTTNIAKFIGVKNDGVMVGQLFQGVQKHPLAWLSELDFSGHPQTHLTSRVEGTCKWFLDSDQFASWVGGNRQPLWCPGDAGTGKTYITSIVIDHLQRLERTKSDRIVYFYFEQHRKDVMSPSKVFGTLLKQLIMSTSEDSYAQKVQIMWQTFLDQQTYPSFTTLAEAFRAQAAKFPRVFVILDALDESLGLQGNFVEWSEMKKGILNLCDSGNISLMLTSRSHVSATISDALLENTGYSKLAISAHRDDIRNYVRDRVEKFVSAKALRIKPAEQGPEIGGLCWDDVDSDDSSVDGSDVDSVSVEDSEIGECAPSLLDQIVKAVADTAQSIFLLATLHMKAIQNCNIIADIELALKTLPRDIDGAYDGIMKRIGDRAETDSALARQILSWVSCALRPMTMPELQGALALHPESWKVIKKRATTPRVILSVCEGFITSGVLGEEDFRFIHPTAQDYISRRLAPHFPDACRRISRSCISYLSNGRLSQPPCQSEKDLENLLKKNPFLLYAACNWGHHLRQYEREPLRNVKPLVGSEDPIEMALKMLKSDNLLLNLSQVTFIPAFKNEGYAKGFPQGVTGLHFASQFGTERLLERLIDDLVPSTLHIDVRDTNQKTSLHVAARTGHRGILEILLGHGADIEAATSEGETPLLGAAMNGDYGVVELLLERGANARVTNTRGGTALHWASLNGNPHVVAQLLDHGADVAAIANAEATTWYAINYMGFDAIVWLLSDKLALAGIKNLLGGTPLHWAAINGHHRVVQLLLRRAADVNAKTLMQATPLHAASDDLRSGSSNLRQS